MSNSDVDVDHVFNLRGFLDPRCFRRLVKRVPSDGEWMDFTYRSVWNPAQALWTHKRRLLWGRVSG